MSYTTVINVPKKCPEDFKEKTYWTQDGDIWIIGLDKDGNKWATNIISGEILSIKYFSDNYLDLSAELLQDGFSFIVDVEYFDAESLEEGDE